MLYMFVIRVSTKGVALLGSRERLSSASMDFSRAGLGRAPPAKARFCKMFFCASRADHPLHNGFTAFFNFRIKKAKYIIRVMSTVAVGEQFFFSLHMCALIDPHVYILVSEAILLFSLQSVLASVS